MEKSPQQHLTEILKMDIEHNKRMEYEAKVARLATEYQLAQHRAASCGYWGGVIIPPRFKKSDYICAPCQSLAGDITKKVVSNMHIYNLSAAVEREWVDDVARWMANCEQCSALKQLLECIPEEKYELDFTQFY